MPTKLDVSKVTDYMYIGSAPKKGDPLELVCDIVVLAAEEYQPKYNWNVDVLRAPMDDSIPMRESDKRIANEASDFLVKKVLEGNTILSTCAMGVNRSSLIAALTILKLHPNLSYRDVIDLIKVTRGVDLISNGVSLLPLSNSAFVRFIRQSTRISNHGRVHSS